MNYCLIEDAWGKNNYISQQYKENNTQSIGNDINQTKFIESFSCDNNYSQVSNHIEKFDNIINQNINNKNSIENSIENSINDTTCDCDKLLLHILKCKSCHNKILKLLNTNNRYILFNNLNEIIDNNKDIIILILIGLAILLFFNLINNLLK
jgi:hypothetical protein